jgi:zinc and cadmium transporter
MFSPAMMAAWLLVAGALLGAAAPSMAWFWAQHRDALMAVSAGLLLGTAFLHLVPESAESGGWQGPALLAGFLGVLVVESATHFLVGGGHGTPDHAGHDHPHDHLHVDHDGVDAHERHLPVSAFVGFSLHGLVDGAALYAAQGAGTALSTGLALLAHHVPLSASVASLFMLGGSRRIFWPLVVTSSLTPVVGLVAAQVGLGGESHHVLSAVAAGVFLYLATHNLLPLVDLEKHRGKRLLGLAAGVAVAGATRALGG